MSKTDLQGHVSKRPNILNASFCDQEEEFQKMSSIENKWLGFGIGFHVDAITDLSSLELIRFFTDPQSQDVIHGEISNEKVTLVAAATMDCLPFHRLVGHQCSSCLW